MSSAACACAPPSFEPLAAACRIAFAASCSWRAASLRFCRCCSRVSCSSRRAASSTSCASCRWLSPPPAPPLWFGRRHPPLPLGFLLLPPRQLLQLLEQLVDLLVAALLLGALLHLVLVRELVDLELEQIGEIFRHLVLPAAAATAAALLGDLHLVLLLGVLQQLQRALFGRQRFLGLLALELSFGGLHFLRRLGQRLGNRLEGRIDRVEAAVHLAAQLFDLLPQLRLRQGEEHRVLAELVRASSWPCRARC